MYILSGQYVESQSFRRGYCNTRTLSADMEKIYKL